MSTLRVGNITATGGTGTITVPTGNRIAQTGAVLQVVSTTKTDIFSASVNSGATSDVTGLNATITPSSTSSKILVLASITGMYLALGNYYLRTAFQLKRGTTVIGGGTTAGNRTSIIAGTYIGDTFSNQGAMNLFGQFLDSPNTTNATTYGVTIFNNSEANATVYVNQIGNDANVSYIGRPSSTITLIEVAG